MTSPMPVALPYGIRDCKLTPYSDSSGTVLGNTSIDLPYMQTFSFSETEEFQELRGDDKVITTRGQGAQVEWSLESGGISLKAWAVFTGGTVTESGTTPNRKVTLRKLATANRPYFRIEGQAISDSGGDLHAIVYRCRCNDTIEGEFADGEFFVTSVSGLGLPLLDSDFDLLYDFVQNETLQAISSTPAANPFGPPSGLTNGAVTSTSVVLNWAEVPGASGYKVEKSSDGGSTWSSAGTDPADGSTTTLTASTLTAATTYLFRISTKKNGTTSSPSAPISVTTPAS
ncbi:major tail protein [Gordonia phage Jalebi]|uniref:Major tail protein n=1 Tax=Gordonia phage Jalebi TaxID=2910757 RepID=A0AA49BNT7_9CAUD|nr:major tail protein [Gordonia phage Jalebi]WNM69372.1 major tail protein [Gordonia phage Sampudon]